MSNKNAFDENLRKLEEESDRRMDLYFDKQLLINVKKQDNSIKQAINDLVYELNSFVTDAFYLVQIIILVAILIIVCIVIPVILVLFIFPQLTHQ